MREDVTTSYGLSVILTDNVKEINPIFFKDYDKMVGESQLRNYGFYIVDGNTRTIIDNEDDISALVTEFPQYFKK